jgi:nicotinamide-nucleotide amidase
MSFHTHACILSTGDEIITGQLLDTNSRYLAEQLTSLGISIVEFAAIPDDLDALVHTLRRLASRAPLLIMSGGLGPTEGDLTRHALAVATGQGLVTDEAALRHLTAWLAGRGRTMNERQARQALRPSGATCLPNAVGTAPGLHSRIDSPTPGAAGTDVFCLPGPPGELSSMWLASVVPMLRPEPSRVVATRLLHVVGIPEADLVTRLGPIMKRDRVPLIGVTASQGVLTLRLRMAASTGSAQAEQALDADEATLGELLGDHLFGRGQETLPAVVLSTLRARHQTLATVESCTGGLLGALLTAIPGSSASFAGGLLTYSNELKTRLAGVDPALIAAHGAVSEQVASAMAAGGLHATGAHHAVAITGIAGPDGGSPAKPVGTVCIAHAWQSKSSTSGPAAPVSVDVRRFRFTGDRDDIRQRAARTGLAMVYFQLFGRPLSEPRLLWQLDAPK